MAERLIPGTPAPDFTLKDSAGNDVSLQSHRGRNTIVYFYPAASTPGCTKEACDFRDTLASLQREGYDVLGVSPDPVGKLAKFADAEGLTFPLLSDEDHSVAEAYGGLGGKEELRTDLRRPHPLHDRGGPGGQGGGGAVQRAGHRPCGQAAPGPRPGVGLPPAEPDAGSDYHRAKGTAWQVQWSLASAVGRFSLSQEQRQDKPRRRRARVVKLADTQDLGSCAFGRGGSSPPLRTAVRTPESRTSRSGIPPFNANGPVPEKSAEKEFSRSTHPLPPNRRIPIETPTKGRCPQSE